MSRRDVASTMGSDARPAAGSANHRFLGRQAILDSQMKLYGYELLFRSGTNNSFSGDQEDATNQTIDSCLSMVACSSPTTQLFVNCTRGALVSMRVKLLPSRTVVLEILEDIVQDAEVVLACRELKRCGYRIALDDYSPDEGKLELVGIADFVKIDFRLSDAAARQRIYQLFRNTRTAFLAEKVETLEEVRRAQEEGNTFYQGYFHSQPEVIAETQISAIRSVYVELLGALAEFPMDFGKVERLLIAEPSLCFRLLRLANSVIYGLRHQVSTIQAALHTVGEDAFRKLVSLVLAGNLSHAALGRDAEQALERACFCEAIAPSLNESPAELYMLGMLSMMDRMLHIPMSQLVGLIPVDARIQQALLGSATGMGRALVLCRYHEQGGESQGLAHPDEFARDSAACYFEALLAAGSLHKA